MPLSIGGRLIARNAALNVAGQGIPLLVALATMPLVARGLGAERFGVLSIAWMAVAYFGELGFGRATTKYVAEVLGGERHQRLSSVVWATVLTQAAIGLAGGLAFAAVAPLLAERVFRITPAVVTEARTAFLVLAAMLPVVTIASSLRGVLEGGQRFGVSNAIRIPASTANFILPLVGLWLGWGLPGIFVLLLASRVATALAFGWAAARAYPAILMAPRREEVELGQIWRFGGWLTLSSVVSPILVYLDRFLLGALVSMAAVGYYTAPFELVLRVAIVPAAIFATLFPAYSTLGSRGEWPQIRRLTRAALRSILLVLTPIVLLLALLAPTLLEVWLGADFARQSSAALRVLAVGVLINSLAFVPSSLLQGMGRADVTAKLHLLELPVQLPLAWILISSWGITGAAIAWTLRVTLDAVLLFVASAHLCPQALRAPAAPAAVAAGPTVGI